MHVICVVMHFLKPFFPVFHFQTKMDLKKEFHKTLITNSFMRNLGAPKEEWNAITTQTGLALIVSDFSFFLLLLLLFLLLPLI